MLGFSFGGTNEGRERARVKDSQKGQPTRYTYTVSVLWGGVKIKVIPIPFLVQRADLSVDEIMIGFPW